MNHTTLLFLLKNNQILLAMKKRGFGAHRWNGVGGKIEPGETIERAAIRECQEEIGVTPHNLEKVAHHTFYVPNLPASDGFICHAFTTRVWQGEPIETDEMAPKWFTYNTIPYDKMWQDDRHWLPHVLNGKKLVGKFTFDEQDAMTGKNITIVTADHELLQ